MTEFPGELPYNPRMRDLLSAAQDIARESGQLAVGAEHMQLAILADAHAIPTQILTRMHWDTTEFAAHLRTLLKSAGYNRGSGQVRESHDR